MCATDTLKKQGLRTCPVPDSLIITGCSTIQKRLLLCGGKGVCNGSEPFRPRPSRVVVANVCDPWLEAGRYNNICTKQVFNRKSAGLAGTGTLGFKVSEQQWGFLAEMMAARIIGLRLSGLPL